MIVKEKFRKLLMRLRDPMKVLGFIPQAKMLEYKGKSLTVVPFEDDVVKVLRNVGIKNVPSTIEYYYDFPIRPGWEPMKHQITTAAFLTEHSRAYCLNDLGTAKTLSALWAYDYLRSQGKAERCLVISPLSTVERTWGDEIFTHLPHLNFAVLHGSKAKRLQMLSTKPDIAIINHHGVNVIKKALMKERFDLVIIDEVSQCARNAQTDMWKAINSVIHGVKYVWGMTGTPIPNSPMDAWAQCKLITPHTVPAYATHFKTKVMNQVSTYKWVPKPDSLDTVFAAMQPGIRFKRDEVIDLPPVMYETRQCPLTKEQDQAYKEMWRKMKYEGAEGSISAANEAIRVTKLMQICSGVAIGDDKRVVMPPKPRLLELLQAIAEAEAKVIVFSPYRGPLDLIQHVVSKKYPTAVIHGGVPKKERDKIFADFQQKTEPHVIVAQPVAMSHGLTLTEANVIIWFAPPNSAETYQQANGRITRPGQKRNQLIINLQATALERRVYQRLKDRSSMQGVLLDMFKE